MKCLIVEPTHRTRFSTNPFNLFNLVAQFDKTIPLGVCTIAGCFAGEGWEVAIDDRNTDGLSDEAFLAKVETLAPDLIGISVCFTSHATSALSLIADLRARFPATRIVVGGTHATFCPEESLRAGADYVALREAEETAGDLARALAEGADARKIPGLAILEEDKVVFTGDRLAPSHLDELPPPAFDGLSLARYTSSLYPLTSGRGCNHSCYYCASPGFSKGMRFRSIEHVMQEIKHARTLGFRAVGFADDNLAAHRERFLEICQEMRATGMIWEFNGYGSELDREMLQAAAASACKSIRIGVETGAAALLNKVKRGNTLASFQKLVATIREFGMTPVCGFMFPHYSDTAETVAETKEFIKQLSAMGAVCNVTMTAPFPGSSLGRHPDFYKIKVSSTNWDDYDLRTPTFSTAAFSEAEIKDIFLDLENLFFESAALNAKRMVKKLGVLDEEWMQTLVDRINFVPIVRFFSGNR